MKILYLLLFFGSFLPSWIRIRNLNADPCGSGSATLPEDGDGGGDGGVGAEDELWGGGEDALQIRHLVQVDVGGVRTVVLEHAAAGVGGHQP
jgi:hypothetical protein